MSPAAMPPRRAASPGGFWAPESKRGISWTEYTPGGTKGRGVGREAASSMPLLRGGGALWMKAGPAGAGRGSERLGPLRLQLQEPALAPAAPHVLAGGAV